MSLGYFYPGHRLWKRHAGWRKIMKSQRFCFRFGSCCMGKQESVLWEPGAMGSDGWHPISPPKSVFQTKLDHKIVDPGVHRKVCASCQHHWQPTSWLKFPLHHVQIPYMSSRTSRMWAAYECRRLVLENRPETRTWTAPSMSWRCFPGSWLLLNSRSWG